MMNFLGIETSCDETSVAIISGDRLTSNLISSQHFHHEYGGVVPELSSRAHLQILKPLLEKALSISSLRLKEIDVIFFSGQIYASSYNWKGFPSCDCDRSVSFSA